MTAFLPQHDPDPRARDKSLRDGRSRYQYNYTHISPLALVERVPIDDEFSYEWLAAVAERILVGCANACENQAENEYRDYFRGKHRLFRCMLQAGQAEMRGLSRFVREALRFETPLGAPNRPANSLEEYRRLFQVIGLPPIARYCGQDRMFAYLRLAGPNPCLLRRQTENDPRLPVDNEIFARVIAGDSLEAAFAEGRVFLLDYAALDGLEAGCYPSFQKYLYAPLAMFVVDRTSRELRPVAIQCKQQPGPKNPLFTPAPGYDWLLAKTTVEIADANFHEAVAHLARTHLLIEPFVVSTHRQLAPRHPLNLLLRPHFEGTLAINEAAWKHLIADKGVVDQFMAGTIQSSRQAAAEGLLTYPFNEAMLPESLRRRGVDDPETLPLYPYRDDAQLYWNAIHDWVTRYVKLYYNGDQDVVEDGELQAWQAEIAARDGGRIPGFGEQAGRIHTRSYLEDALTMILFTCSVQHAAVNFPQFDVMSYAPLMPMAGYAPAPTRRSGATEQDYLAMLPPLDMAELQVEFGHLLGTVHYTQLGRYPAGHFPDPRVEAPLQTFQRELAEIGRTIEQRNRQRIPYEFLTAAGIPQSINV